MEQVSDLEIEVNGVRFPAVNIQFFNEALELKEIDDVCDRPLWFGVYFEIMFETGWNLTVYQEAVEIANGFAYSDSCTVDDVDHFFVELTRSDEKHQFIYHAYHCVGEDELLRVLIKEKKELAA